MNGFQVYQIDTATKPVPTYHRRDFYTVYLLTGLRWLACADQEIELTSTCLCFGKLPETETKQGGAPRQTGYACRFNEEFFKENGQVVSQEQWSLVNGRTPRAFSLHAEQATYLTSLFQKMLAEQQSAYRFKDELLRSYLHLVLHEAMRLRQPSPKRHFRHYFRLPGSAGGLASGWGRRRVQ